MIQLKNDELQINVKKVGAELTSIKYKDYEYLWQADSKFWGRHAPVLFPIVGRLKNDECTIKGQTYNMSQHGFARDMEFEVFAQTANSITFMLTNNEETMKKYPYEFELYIKYEIVENKVLVKYTVVNAGNDNMFFSIGAHPGFNIEGEFNDCTIEFDNNETQNKVFVDKGLIKFTDEIRLENTNTLKLKNDSFAEDAIIFKDLESSTVTLSSKGDRKVKMNIAGFPYLGIWSKENAPFVCIEPWFGIADTEEHDGTFRKKKGIIELDIGEEFEASYTIEVM